VEPDNTAAGDPFVIGTTAGLLEPDTFTAAEETTT
jgi:hypothetical protein